MDYETKPTSRNDLRRFAAYFRQLFDVPQGGAFPVLEALDKLSDVFEGSNYVIVDDKALPPQTMAQCTPNDKGGQHYKSIGALSSDSNVKVIIQDSKSVKAPEYSHTPGRIYAVVKDGQLKHLAYYDDSHKQAVSIDFAHEHQGVQPHRHVYLNHDKNSPGVPPTASEEALIKKIKKEFHLR